MRHAKGFAKQAAEFQRLVRRDAPEAEIKWERFLTLQPDGDATGRATVTAPGYKPKSYIIWATPRGHWYTL